MLEPLGIRLLVPDTAEEAAGRAPGRRRRVHVEHAHRRRHRAPRHNCAGIVCYSVGHGLRRRQGRGDGARHPGLELPDLEQRGGLRPRDAADPRRPAPAAAARPRRPARATGTSTRGRARRRSTGFGPGRSGSSGSGGSAISWPRSCTASGRRSSPMTRTSRARRDPEVELVSLDELCARSDIIVSCALADRHVARAHQRRDAGEDEARRDHRQRVARRDRRRAGAPRRPRLGARRLRRARRALAGTARPGRTTCSPRMHDVMLTQHIAAARPSRSPGSTSRPRSRSSSSCARPAGCRRHCPRSRP